MNAIATGVEAVRILAALEGPSVTSCFQCEQPLPVVSAHWVCARSDRGRVVALLPYCDACNRQQSVIPLGH